MKIKRIVFIVVMALALSFLAGCASLQRGCKSCTSDMNGGLYRVVCVYDYCGNLIAQHEGLIDIDDNENGSIMFELNGKRYVYYNAIIAVIEK